MNLIMGSDTAWCVGCGERKPKRKMDFVRYDLGFCRACCNGNLHKPQPFIDEKKRLDFLMSPFQYSEPVRNALLAFKFDACVGYRYIFAHYINQMLDAFMAQEERDWIHTYNVVIPVPLSARRLRERGYNQAELVAREVSTHIGIPLDTEMLYKIHHTGRQSEVSWENRAANVRGCYQVNELAVRGKHIILIDDIYTSGATMAECADTLKAAGAAGVMGITVARTIRREKTEAQLMFEELEAMRNPRRIPMVAFR